MKNKMLSPFLLRLARLWHGFSVALCVAAIGIVTSANIVQAKQSQPVLAALLLNMSTGQILYEKNADVSIPPASLTKVMTMYLALDAVKSGNISLEQKARISRTAARTGGSSMHLKTGEKIPLVRLLTGMAVASGNDAAIATAQWVNRNLNKFVAQMNVKARKLGLSNTVFKNPTGLPAQGQKTTARDMMTLCRAYLRNHPQAMRFHNTRFFLHRGRVLHNTNSLLGTVPGVNGLKTGFTNASGYNLVLTAQRNDTRLMAIILGGKTRDERDDLAHELLEAGFRHPSSPAKVRKEFARVVQKARVASLDLDALYAYSCPETNKRHD